MGDYCATAVDGPGFVMVASGDATQLESFGGQARVPILPIFIRQHSGPSLTGKDCTASSGTQGASARSPASSPQVVASGTPNTSTGAPLGLVLPVLLLPILVVALARLAQPRKG